MQRDPAGYAGGMSRYQYVASNPLAYNDPTGLLQRRQVEWWAKNNMPGWGGIDKASQAQVKAAIQAMKASLSKQFGDCGFSKGADWTDADDCALEQCRKNNAGNAAFKDFPGNTCTPMGCKEALNAVRDAIKKYKDQGGNRDDFSEALALALAFRESSWNSSASAYGNTAAKSTAVGMCAITRGAYGNYKDRLKGIGPSWDESILSDPTMNLAAAMLILQGDQVVRGKSLRDLLRYYHDGSLDKAAGVSYADAILKAADFLKDKDLSKMTEQECQQLKFELDGIVHPK